MAIKPTTPAHWNIALPRFVAEGLVPGLMTDQLRRSFLLNGRRNMLHVIWDNAKPPSSKIERLELKTFQ
jgi:hypothetical protein